MLELCSISNGQASGAPRRAARLLDLPWWRLWSAASATRGFRQQACFDKVRYETLNSLVGNVIQPPGAEAGPLSALLRPAMVAPAFP